MSQEKLYFYIITLIWAYIIAIIGPILFLGEVIPAGSGHAAIEFLFRNFFFLTTYVFTAETAIATFIINMCSTFIIGIISGWIITRLAVKKEYTRQNSSKQSLPATK